MSTPTRVLTESQRYWEEQAQQLVANPGTYLGRQWTEFCAAPSQFVMDRMHRAGKVNEDNIQWAAQQTAAAFEAVPSPSKILFCYPPTTTYKATQIALNCSAAVGGVASVVVAFAVNPFIGIMLALSSFGNFLGSGISGEAFGQQSLADTNVQLRRSIQVTDQQNAVFATRTAQLTDQVAALTRERNAFRVENARLAASNTRLSAEIGRLSVQIANLTQQLATFGAENATFRSSNAELNANIAGLRAQITGLNEQLETLRTTNTQLTANVTRLETKIADLERELESFRTENAALRANVQDFRAQNTSLEGNIANLRSQIGLLSVERASLEALVAQFQSQFALFQTGSDQDRQALTGTLGRFTEQLTAYQALWHRVSHEAGVFRDTYTAQLAQLSALITPLTDPRNTTAQLEVLQQTKAAIAEHLQQLAALNVQIAQREGQLRARDELLVALREAHTHLLAGYGKQNGALRAEVTRLSELIHRTMPTTVEVTVKRDVGLGNTLGIRCAPNWEETAPFACTAAAEWSGRIPLGTEFKFVVISANGEVTWEQGVNHKVGDPRNAAASFESFTIVI